MIPDAAPPSHPPPPRDLSDAEFAELDELLAATPEPLSPCDVVMLDGYLCGVIVQPMLLEPAVWLPPVFDFEGRARPDDMDPAWRDRVYALILRRYAAINRNLGEHGWFDPMLLEPDEGPAEASDQVIEAAADAATDPATSQQPRPASATGAESVNTSNTDADADAHADADTDGVAHPDADAGLNPISRPLLPWVAGFDWAIANFPALDELDDDAVMAALARIYRHAPPETDEQRAVVDTLDREQPLTTFDDAVEELVACVADLWDLTREARYRVETIRRDGAKVGRNDPCPCGSGKKSKQCHGK